MSCAGFTIRAIIVLTSIFLNSSAVFAQSSLNLYDSKDLEALLYPDREKTISMDFKGAALNDVLKIFSQQSGLNFIASDAVSSRTVNLYLDKVPVDQALERILSANGLTYELQEGSNIFVVKPVESPQDSIMTRIYRLKHATVASSKIFTTLTAGDSSQSSSSGSSGSSNSSSSGSQGSRGGNSQQPSAALPGIVGAVRSILSPSGSVVEDPRTNSIIVTDLPSRFPRIEQLIARLDVKIPQVLIEVEMLDISKDTADLLGAKWGNTPVAFAGAEKDTAYPFNTDNAVDDLGGEASTLLGDLNGYNVGTLSFSGLNFTLQFLRTKSDTRNLARPRILTINNETAEIEITADEVITVTSSTSSGGSITRDSVEVERADTGVSLRVTPQANVETGEITMAIEPKVTEARASRGIAGALALKDPEVRTTRSILRVFDGDTIVIGGLLRTDTTDIQTHVPVLGKLPFLGNAFRHKDKSELQRELIVFITPHIILDNVVPSSDSKNTPLIREQNMPASKRQKQIDKEVNYFEKQGQ
jgi:type IV pilus assembly protein PilQ